jgi:hypothetical protein
MFNASPTLGQLADALAKAQAKMPTIIMDRTVQYKAVSFEYATLSNIIHHTKPVLSEFGLSILQFPTSSGSEILVETLLLHLSGEYVSSVISARCAKPDDPKETGSLITYLRRYSYAAVLGIATDGDSDGEVISEKYLETPDHRKWLRDVLTPMGIDDKTLWQVSSEMKRANYELSEDAVKKALDHIKRQQQTGSNPIPPRTELTPPIQVPGAQKLPFQPVQNSFGGTVK